MNAEFRCNQIMLKRWIPRKIWILMVRTRGAVQRSHTFSGPGEMLPLSNQLFANEHYLHCSVSNVFSWSSVRLPYPGFFSRRRHLGRPLKLTNLIDCSASDLGLNRRGPHRGSAGPHHTWRWLAAHQATRSFFLHVWQVRWRINQRIWSHQNFERLVLGSIDADLCKNIFVGKLFMRSTRFTSY